MTAVITLLAVGAYALAWLLTARRLYARWRDDWAMSAHCCPAHGLPSDRYQKCCYDARADAPAPAAACAMAAALLWPGVLLVALVRFRPPPTAAERKAAEVKLRARVTELERELGMKP